LRLPDAIAQTTRVTDFVNRGAGFDLLFLYEPLLAACCEVIGRPFKLSTMHARSLHANAPAQELHVDFARGGNDRAVNMWPMVGFIYMVDAFRPENGATCFVPGSHLWSDASARDQLEEAPHVSACGPPGSVIVFNGSVWHGHGRNSTGEPRRSIQGAFIHREAQSGVDWAVRMRPDTLARLTPLARDLLAL
jgi:ectoine hydroxylase-related dioxygenase (phytanoyl-CoA dioxygenase family)